MLAMVPDPLNRQPSFTGPVVAARGVLIMAGMARAAPAALVMSCRREIPTICFLQKVVLLWNENGVARIILKAA
jgi:hypothetical protein